MRRDDGDAKAPKVSAMQPIAEAERRRRAAKGARIDDAHLRPSTRDLLRRWCRYGTLRCAAGVPSISCS